MKRRAVKKKRVWKSTTAMLGFDVSVSSIAGAAVGYDQVLKRWMGPVTTISRWTSDDGYLSRLEKACRADAFVHDLIFQLGISPELHEIFIAVEEPWPYGMAKRGESGWLKQQAQVTGAFLGGLMRYGYRNVFEINNMDWRSIIAKDLGITTHYTSWGKGVDGKMRSKEWAEEFKGYRFDFPDLIGSKHGLKDKPETSRAKPVQPADQYDALAICEWMKGEVRRSLK